MEIVRLPIIKGMSLALLDGTNRYAYAISDFEDAWGLKDWQKHGGYPGSVLYLYDLDENKVYVPFEKKKNVLYQQPLFANDKIYFLQIDYDMKKVNLYCISSLSVLEKVTDLSIDEVNLYNIGLTGEKVHITSMDEYFVCYYPEYFECKLEPNESVLCIEGNKIYIQAWFEEGVEKNEITNDYLYYEKLRIKDKQGNLISEEIGVLTQFSDGKWRMS